MRCRRLRFWNYFWISWTYDLSPNIIPDFMQKVTQKTGGSARIVHPHKFLFSALCNMAYKAAPRKARLTAWRRIPETCSTHRAAGSFMAYTDAFFTSLVHISQNLLTFHYNYAIIYVTAIETDRIVCDLQHSPHADYEKGECI